MTTQGYQWETRPANYSLSEWKECPAGSAVCGIRFDLIGGKMEVVEVISDACGSNAQCALWTVIYSCSKKCPVATTGQYQIAL